MNLVSCGIIEIVLMLKIDLYHEVIPIKNHRSTLNILKDCIRNTTAVCNPRQIQSETNSVKDKIQSETNSVQNREFSPRQIQSEKIFFSIIGKTILGLNLSQISSVLF